MWKTERKPNQSEIAVSSLGEAKKTVSMIYLKLGHHLYGKTPLNITLRNSETVAFCREHILFDLCNGVVAYNLWCRE
jgi:hypothetical protein